VAQENRPGSTIATPRGVRPRPDARPIWLDQRWGECRCGWVDVYAIARTLTGKGSSELDPGRLMNQKCKGCGAKLGRGAGRRAQERPLSERRAQRCYQREMARHGNALAVSKDLGRRSSLRSTAETPAETSAAKVAPGASSAAVVRCCEHQRDVDAPWHCLKRGCCCGYRRCSVSRDGR